MSNWFYKGKEILEVGDMPENVFGFVYKTYHKPTNAYYIGKKQLFSKQKRKFGKREIEAITDKRAKHWEYVIKESDWKTYYGSQKEIKALIKESKQDDFSREILMFVPSKKLLSYYETKYLFAEGVIEPGSTYLNDNIESRYFRKDFQTIS